MIYLNEMAKKHGVFWLWELVLPEMYNATTLTDFVKNRGELKPTKKILPFGSFFNGSCLVFIGSRVTYSNVSETVGRVSDMGSTVDLTFGKDVPRAISINKDRRASLRDGQSLYDSFICYRPSDGLTCLFNYKENGPLERVKGRNGVLCPAPVRI